MAKTHRSNSPLKRHHWHSARTERRGRFSRGWFWAQDEDLAFRRRGKAPSWARGRGAWVRGGMEWLTADKSHVRWLISGARLPRRRAAVLAEKLHIRSAGEGTGAGGRAAR